MWSLTLAMQPVELKGLKGQKLKKAQMKWIAINRDLVRVAFNECRNSASNNLRDEAIKRGIANQVLPTPEQIFACITRDKKLMESDEGKALFDDYVDNWLKCCAFPEHWDKDIRLCETVSKAMHQDEGVPKIDCSQPSH